MILASDLKYSWWIDSNLASKSGSSKIFRLKAASVVNHEVMRVLIQQVKAVV